MTRLPKIIHLLDDVSLGGVTKNLELFRHPALGRRYDFEIREVQPSWSIAPHYDAGVIIVHFSVNWKTLPFLYSLAFRNPGASLVLVEHSYSREWEYLHVPEKFRFRSMLKLAYNIFDRVICVSKAQALWLEEIIDLTPPKRQLIYPWSNFAGLTRLERPDFCQDGPITIGAFGRFVGDKGFESLISAFHRMGSQDTIKLRLGGFGPDEEKLKRLAAGNPNISFYGKVDSVGDFLSQCDIVAVPSKYEAYGLVATEARRAARPILVSNVGGLPEQVGDAGLSIDFDNIDGVAKTLKNIRYQPLIRMSVAGRESCLRTTDERLDSWLGLLRGLDERASNRSFI